MSIVTLFTKTAPTLAGVEFDAVLEDTLSLSVTYTSYPVESGAMARDHGIIQPFKWSITGAISDNPVRPTLQGIAAGLLSEIDDGGILPGLAGVSAGLLSGSSDTRSSNALEFLIQLTQSRTPFDVSCGDYYLKNMVIESISRKKEPENENALIFTAELVELPTLDTLVSRGVNPNLTQLREGDPSYTQSVSSSNLGAKVGSLFT